MIFYYSGCGNSRWIATLLAERLGEPLIEIPTALKNGAFCYTLQKKEKVGFVFPVYAWRPPEIVRYFVQNLALQYADGVAKNPYTYVVCTCGDNIGMADKVFAKTLEQAQLPMNSFVSITMPETYINLPGFYLDTMQDALQKIELAHSNLGLVTSRLKPGSREVKVVRGTMPYCKTYLVGPLFERYTHRAERHFRVNAEACISCGKCAEVCPVDKIEMTEGKPHWVARDATAGWKRYCLSCMACYHQCPQNAIHYGNETKGKGQYKFTEVYEVAMKKREEKKKRREAAAKMYPKGLNRNDRMPLTRECENSEIRMPEQSYDVEERGALLRRMAMELESNRQGTTEGTDVQNRLLLEQKVKMLERKNARLEKELDIRDVKACIFDMMIDVAERECQEDIRKNEASNSRAVYRRARSSR